MHHYFNPHVRGRNRWVERVTEHRVVPNPSFRNDQLKNFVKQCIVIHSYSKVLIFILWFRHYDKECLLYFSFPAWLLSCWRFIIFGKLTFRFKWIVLNFSFFLFLLFSWVPVPVEEEHSFDHIGLGLHIARAMERPSWISSKTASVRQPEILRTTHRNIWESRKLH